MMKPLDLKNLTTEIKLLITISVISCSVMLLRFLNVSAYKTIIEQFALFSDWDIFNYRVWQFFTYNFIHADVLHLLFNMVMLYLFSQLFYTFFTAKQLLKVFILGGITAGVFYFVVSNLFGFQNYVIGASGAVMALFFAVVGYNPKMRVHLIIVGAIPIYYIAIAFILFDVVQLFSNNAGGHLAHIGGSVFGFIYGNNLKGFTFMKFQKPKKNSHLKTVHKVNQPKNKIEVDVVQKQIDVILDKISKSGYESLTTEEKEFLFKQK